jgi:hypothetical protein
VGLVAITQVVSCIGTAGLTVVFGFRLRVFYTRGTPHHRHVLEVGSLQAPYQLLLTPLPLAGKPEQTTERRRYYSLKETPRWS